jgi:hypothetical protein
MLKKTMLLLSVSLPLSCSQVFAGFEEDEKERTVRLKNPQTEEEFTFRSASESDFYDYSRVLSSLPIKDGYPALDEQTVNRYTAQNLDRQKDGNPYHFYRLSFKGERMKADLGFVQFGRMPTLGYDEGITPGGTEHYPIIQTWMDLGITRQKSSMGGLGKEDMERIENRGIAMIVPIFPKEVQENQDLGRIRGEAIEACYEMVCWRAQQGKLLPVEKTDPEAVISLFRPDDPARLSYLSAGFRQNDNPGFGWFYPKTEMVNDSQSEKPVTLKIPQPRVMMVKPVKVD